MNGKFSKLNRNITIIFMLVIVALFLNFNEGCKDPNDYKPPEDTLDLPPAAPQLVYPLNNTEIYYEDPFPHEVEFQWTAVEGSELYEFQTSNDTIFNSIPQQITTNSLIFVFNNNMRIYWRVRAYSSHWQYYTNWSEVWRLGVYYAP